MTVALVTGASSGIGLAFARLLASDGIDLVLVARRADALEQLAAELREAHGVRVEVVPTDLTGAGAIDALTAMLDTNGLAIDILINNAGAGLTGDFAAMPEADLDRMASLNMVAPTLLARALLPAMIGRGRGHVLNVASTASFQPGPGMAVYFASKAYVTSLSQALWMELRHTGVGVTALCPGPTRSEFGARSGIAGTRVFGGLLPLASAESVASYGYRAMRRGQRLAIPGIFNRIMALSARYAPLRLTLAVSRFLLSP
jgi:short-subunit dehydrogenase